MDRIFRYDRLDLLVDFLCEKVGEEVEVGSANTSPERSFALSEECEIELRKFFAPRVPYIRAGHRGMRTAVGFWNRLDACRVAQSTGARYPLRLGHSGV